MIKVSKIGLLYRYGLGIIGLKPDDIILTSYPKSGNTWVRFFYANLISQIYLNDRLVTYKWLDEIMPEIGASNLWNNWDYGRLPRIIKTHNRYWPLYKKNYTILLLRDPRDVMISYYFFEKKRKKPYKRDFHSFIRSQRFGLKNCFRHFISWESRADLILKYEDLKRNDITGFKCMIRKMPGISPSESLIEKAIRNARFEKIQQIEKKFGHPKLNNHQDDYLFARKGQVGEWKEYFDKEDLEYYNRLKERYGIHIY